MIKRFFRKNTNRRKSSTRCFRKNIIPAQTIISYLEPIDPIPELFFSNESEKEPIDTEIDEENLQCSICMTNKKCMALSPCNHLCCCYNCVKQIDSCPMCRTKIKSVKQIFI